ncbi:hypothetical protein PILCRDRAFT_9050 [Piloderma croceum F 1598]|uniref:Uncharacterized protein n=1 Tax=Piloderma croceum (strain F 1598) TaxID=765440 RepID=A0A0C3FMK0_PILCF|nr:hypothetical protein PILCRDRAFT_9050 [Piloderma croceum F 1598]
MKEGDTSWFTEPSEISLSLQNRDVGDSEENNNGQRNNDAPERLVQARQYMQTWTAPYGNVGNWPARLHEIYVEAKKEEEAARQPHTVRDWYTCLHHQLLEGEAILNQAYMVLDGDLPTAPEEVRALFREAGDLLGTLHHGLSCMRTCLTFVDYEICAVT